MSIPSLFLTQQGRRVADFEQVLRLGILRPSSANVTAGRGLADLCGCVYWPTFYRPGTAQCSLT